MKENQIIHIPLSKAFIENLLKCVEDSIEFVKAYNTVMEEKHKIRRGILYTFSQLIELLKRALAAS